MAAMPTGVTVSQKGRIFVDFPKWRYVLFTVAEILDGKTVAYPDEVLNQSNADDPAGDSISVKSVVNDPKDRLWIFLTGGPLFQPTDTAGQRTCMR